MSDRQPGYYWVRSVSGGWLISEWSPNDGEWFHSGMNGYGVKDDYFSEINETRIPEPHDKEYLLFLAFRDSLRTGNPFKYDPDTNTLSVFERADPRIISVTASFQDGTSKEFKGCNIADAESGISIERTFDEDRNRKPLS